MAVCRFRKVLAEVCRAVTAPEVRAGLTSIPLGRMEPHARGKVEAALQRLDAVYLVVAAAGQLSAAAEDARRAWLRHRELWRHHEDAWTALYELREALKWAREVGVRAPKVAKRRLDEALCDVSARLAAEWSLPEVASCR